jgi:hypothetical protein
VGENGRCNIHFMLHGCYPCRYKEFLHIVPQKFGYYVEKWTPRDSENGNLLYVKMAHKGISVDEACSLFLNTVKISCIISFSRSHRLLLTITDVIYFPNEIHIFLNLYWW